MGMRERRLQADYEAILALTRGGDRISVVEADGTPPERYKLNYRVKGLVVQDHEVRPVHRHVVEVHLTLAYPRQAPQCRMLTPVFHPNIAPHAICIGDHWAASESLASLLVRIAEMFCFQSYNLKSPLNGDAARWAEEHPSRLPLESFDFGRLLSDEQVPAQPLPQPSRVADHHPARPQNEHVDRGVTRTSSLGEPTPQLTASQLLVDAQTVNRSAIAGGMEASKILLRNQLPPVRQAVNQEAIPARSLSAHERVPQRDHPGPSDPARQRFCPHCRAAFSLAPGFVGKWIRCPFCRQMIEL